MNIPRSAACLLWVLTILTSGAVAQSTPQDSSQDQRILAEVKKRFANEHAFDGMSISPSVRHGIVTLSETVNSQAAKVLASRKIEDVDGIKSVMNNLNVAGGTANASPSGTAVGEVEDKKVILPFGTILPVHLSKEISSKTAKANDVFHGTIASDVNANGYILVPAGTPVQGTVKEAKSGGLLTGQASLTIDVDQMTLNFPEGPHPVRFATEPLSGRSQTGGVPTGSVAEALGIKGTEVVARPDQVLRFRMLQPAFVSVKLKGGRQVPPVPVEQTSGTSAGGSAGSPRPQ